MKKLTYAEQLKHPIWQRKRLEVLEHYGFECASCGDKEKTLHVHHKQYVKGRMAWEYTLDELEALCEDCHEHQHFQEDRLLKLFHDSCASKEEILGLVGGFMADRSDEPGLVEEARQSGDPHSYAAGALAAWLVSSGMPHAREIYELVVKLNGGRVQHPAWDGAIEEYLSYLRS